MVMVFPEEFLKLVPDAPLTITVDVEVRISRSIEGGEHGTNGITVEDTL